MASFLIVMAVTDPDAPPYQRQSMFVVPARDPGHQHPAQRRPRLRAARRRAARATSATRTCGCRPTTCSGPRGGAFVVAQTRLGGGRIHHAMRTVGLVRRIFDMICERAVSRYTQGEMLGNKQMVQEMIADSWMEIEAFRLLTMQTAWKIDQLQRLQARCAPTSRR